MPAIGGTALDKALLPVAEKFIKTFGTTAKFTHKKFSSYNATTGAVTASDKNLDIKCIIETSNRTQNDTGLVNIAKTITVASKSFEQAPEEGDIVKILSVVYVVGSVVENFSGESVATYTLGLTK